MTQNTTTQPESRAVVFLHTGEPIELPHSCDNRGNPQGFSIKDIRSDYVPAIDYANLPDGANEGEVLMAKPSGARYWSEYGEYAPRQGAEYTSFIIRCLAGGTYSPLGSEDLIAVLEAYLADGSIFQSQRDGRGGFCWKRIKASYAERAARRPEDADPNIPPPTIKEHSDIIDRVIEYIARNVDSEALVANMHTAQMRSIVSDVASNTLAIAELAKVVASLTHPTTGGSL